MSINSYDEEFAKLPTTTITMALLTNKMLDRFSIFALLPVLRGFTALPSKASSKSVDILRQGKIGAIYSVRDYDLGNRGVTYTTKQPFKNCLTVKIETKKKILTVKISSGCIHIVGVHSVEDGIEAGNMILWYLNLIDNSKKSLETELGLETLRWVMESTKGSPCINSNGHSDYLVNFPAVIPSHVDPYLAWLLISYEFEYPFYSNYISKLQYFALEDWSLYASDSCEQIGFSGFDTYMINYNYKLPREIDCCKLAECIDGYYNLEPRPITNNPNVLYVDLEHDHRPNEGKRKKKPKSHHTITFNRSGCVAQSGPTFEKVRQAYNIVMSAIREYGDRFYL